jgi:hypothetical protein
MNIRRLMAGATGALPIVAALVLGACNAHDTLLKVDTPDIVTTDKAQSVAGAQSFYVSGVGEFARFIGGDRNGSSPLGLNLSGGMLGDELFSARNGTEHWDGRSINNTLLPSSSWSEVGTGYVRLVRAARLLAAFPPATGGNQQLATLHALEGMLLTVTAEHYCNGIPLWDGKSESVPLTATYTTDQLYTMAISQFDSALALATADSTKTFANIGKARTMVDQAKKGALAAPFTAAAALVASIPTNFVWNAVFTTNTTGVVNAIYDWSSATQNFGASDKEGINGLDFVSAKDPRVRVDGTKTIKGQDGSVVPQLNQYPKAESPVPVATGIEARMIQAEAYLAANDPINFMLTINNARGTMNGLTPLADPGTQAGREDLLFRERAFWMYLTAHRLGDMRRLIRQYGRGAETVFPTGSYFKGGAYGTDVAMIPSADELNNHDWTGCTDRNP